ncbi:MAG: hypothetical protein ACRDF4_01700 [Rhabdochlamydiaceae bacterium]
MFLKNISALASLAIPFVFSKNSSLSKVSQKAIIIFGALALTFAGTYLAAKMHERNVAQAEQELLSTPRIAHCMLENFDWTASALKER